MEKSFNWISAISGLIGGGLLYLFGKWDGLLNTIVMFTIMDFITGWIKAIYNKQISSEIGFKGILKKVVMFIIIATANVIQNFIGGYIPLREVVITFYICNEGLSLLENAAEFIPIPGKLKDVFLNLRKKNEDREGEE